MISKQDWRKVNFNALNRIYRLEFGDAHINNSAIDNVRQDLSNNYASLQRVQPLYPLMDKLQSEFIAKVKSFLNSPNYEGAMKYMEDEYFELNDELGSDWNVPYSPYLSHQMPGALPPPLCSPHLFPTEIEFGANGVNMRVFMSGFAKSHIGSNDITDIQVEGSESMIRIIATIEQAQLDCFQQNFVGRRVTRVYHLPDYIQNSRINCHYYNDTGVLVIQAPWLL